MLEAKNITKIYKDKKNEFQLFSKLTFSVQKQEMLAIMGPSGSGKSTLLGITSGFDKSFEGNVLIDKKDIYNLSESERNVFRNKNIGFVFQEYNLIKELNCYENIILPYTFTTEKVDLSYAEEIIRMVGLTDKKNLYPFQLSGGERQRTAIARALIMKPKILFADEPTGAIDRRNGLQIMELFRISAKKTGVCILMVTHDKIMANICDRIFYLENGTLKEKVND